MKGELKEFLEEFSRGRSLTKEERDFLERELQRLAPPLRGEVRPVPTAEGTYTLFHGAYGEPYHSTTAGALKEAYEKFLKPSGLLKKAKEAEELTLLEVGFGLGYNCAVTLHHLLELNPSLRVEIVALEKEPPSLVPPLPEPYRSLHEKLLKGEGENFTLRLLVGDARETIKELGKFKADAVFHDAFSPYKNPELWTLDFLALVKEHLKEEGYWVSYTSNLAVRKALLELGFKVGSSGKVGRKRPGTVASLRSPVPPLSQREAEKLFLSPYALPMRDPQLKERPLTVLADYLLRVFRRQKSLYGGLRKS